MTASNGVLAADRRRVAKAIPAMMESFGLAEAGEYAGVMRYRGTSDRFACDLDVIPYIDDDDGHPWLACRLDRPLPQPDLPWDDPANRRIFRDAAEQLDANPHSGKCNCHIFSRVDAAEVLHHFRWHLIKLTGRRPPID